jgi:molybdopterin molybdotransferase
MRPGRPMAFGRIGEACYFGLPGNPVAVMITFYCFVREALLRMMGAGAATLVPVRVRSAQRLRKKPGRTEYQRARLVQASDGVHEAHITGSQGSGVLRSMSEANCLLVLGHDQGTVEAGEWVEAILFDGLT